MLSADVQKLATGITFSTTSLLLTLFCSEVKLRLQRLEVASHCYMGKHSAEHHRQGHWSMDSTTACMREGEWASLWTFCCKQLVLFKATRPQNRLFSEPPTVYWRKHIALHVFSAC